MVRAALGRSKSIEGAILMWHPIESFLSTLRAAEWMPITAVRVLLGIFFCVSGGDEAVCTG